MSHHTSSGTGSGTGMMRLLNADMDQEASLEGFDAYDAQGNQIGDIDGVIAREDSMKAAYVIVDVGSWLDKAFGGGQQFVVPAGEIAEIDDDDQRLYFRSITKNDIQSGRFPKYDDNWWSSNDESSMAQFERDYSQAYTGRQEVDYGGPMFNRETTRETPDRLQLVEERLRVDKERYQQGAVRIGKHVTERTETIQVPIREEKLVIERTPARGETTGATIGENQTIEVPLTTERVRVEKEPVVVEEVALRKESVERNEQVSETVRREELDIDDPEGLVGDRGGSQTRRTADTDRTVRQGEQTYRENDQSYREGGASFEGGRRQ